MFKTRSSHSHHPEQLRNISYSADDTQVARIWGIATKICDCRVTVGASSCEGSPEISAELSWFVIPSKPAVPAGPGSPRAPWNSADGNPCCHTPLEDGHGQAWGEVRLGVNASFPWEIRQKCPQHTQAGCEQLWVCGRRAEPAEPTRSRTESCWDPEPLLPQQQPSLSLGDFQGFPFSSSVIISSFKVFLAAQLLFPAHVSSSQGSTRAGGCTKPPGAPRAARGHLQGHGPPLLWKMCHQCLESDVRCCVSLFHRNWIFLIVWQTSRDHTCQVLLSLAYSPNWIQTDLSLHSPEALIPLSNHLFKLLWRNNTYK